MNMKATFAAGCFWHVEESFREIHGVIATRVGYMGGKTCDPTYEEVCSGDTGHAEVCEVEYDPMKISYESLLERFWKMHDPTQKDRQGPDIGSQYRSIIFFHHRAQETAATHSKRKEQSRLGKTVTTEIIQAAAFYDAEGYHQKYFMKTGKNACR